ncbi:MAG: aspartate-semialdehyde dehydrogenase [Gemmatimonadetes bacterium]|nr:aspartate-semialdehyde dehydrogenase [Gemmatimonadota bacterium]
MSAASSATPVAKAPKTRIPVAVLGATGAVGQTFIRLLADHPWFELAELAASERSAGRTYAEAARWVGASGMPESVRAMPVTLCDPRQVRSPIVFSALDASVAGEVELAFATAGRMVLSNAKNFRMEDDVPLVIPEVNADHLRLLGEQRRKREWSGGIVTNANCAAIMAVMALAPLHQAFGIRRLFIATMQAVSGAGYPGVPSLDILGNVVPFISGEEAKIESEIQKMLGRLAPTRVEHAPIVISAHANRVAVENGHTVCMSVDFEKKVTVADATEALCAWRGDASARGLPSSPDRALVVTDLPDRPQPRRDVEAGDGMTVTVGRIRADPLFAVKLVAMGHNTIRGAAGASVLNAELLVATGQAGAL